MAALRDPQSGCPWDLKQDFSSIAPFTIEEAYEVADAIDRNDMDDLKDELGDLLLQVAFHSQMAAESGLFSFEDVAAGIADKLIRRHPHVFGDGAAESAEDVKLLWESIKTAERKDRHRLRQENNQTDAAASRLDGVATNLPALVRAEKIQKRARQAGFDWNEVAPVVSKVREELDEVMEAHESGRQELVDEEIGDLLFATVNLSRHLSSDPETALRNATLKFSQRFKQVEQLARLRQMEMSEMDLESLDMLWNEVKAGGSSL